MIKNTLILEFETRVEDAVNSRPIPPVKERFAIIEQINEDFYKKTYKVLPKQLLNKLSDWVLVEDINNRDIDKVANNEFPILSDRQMERRYRRENSVESDVMDYLNLKFKKNQDSLAKKSKKRSSDDL